MKVSRLNVVVTYGVEKSEGPSRSKRLTTNMEALASLAYAA